jgi:hypothetical protein
MNKCISRHGQMYQWTWTNVSVDMNKCISRHEQMYLSTDTFVHVHWYICPCPLIHLSMSTDTFVHVYWYICSCLLIHLSTNWNILRKNEIIMKLFRDSCLSLLHKLMWYKWLVNLEFLLFRQSVFDTFVHVHWYICPCLLIHLFMSTDTFVHVYWYICPCLLIHLSMSTDTFVRHEQMYQ